MPLLGWQATARLLRNAGIELARTVLVRSKNEAARAAVELGWPVVLKASSPDLAHKAKLGLVRTTIAGEPELSEAWRALELALKAARKKQRIRLEGFLVQRQHTGTELFLGMRRDKQFGPVISFGFGGLFVELFDDVAFRIAPVSKEDAVAMAAETKSWALVAGRREAIERMSSLIVALSKLAMVNEKLIEIDLNPVILEAKDAIVVDAKVVASA